MNIQLSKDDTSTDTDDNEIPVRAVSDTTTTRTPYREGIAICGFPGAGKSEAGHILAELTDGINIETGDIVREGAQSHFDRPSTELSSDELGDYSTMRRERDGGEYVAQDTIERLEQHSAFPEHPAIITGMRDSESPALFGEFFAFFRIVWIHADFDTRLERLQGRGRQDESAFTKENLARRDGRESMWGTSDCTFKADIHIDNGGSLAELREQLREVA